MPSGGSGFEPTLQNLQASFARSQGIGGVDFHRPFIEQPFNCLAGATYVLNPAPARAVNLHPLVENPSSSLTIVSTKNAVH
jgi:hypothetical protein